MVKITFPDGNIKSFEKQINGSYIAKSISENLLKDSVAIKINNTLTDLQTPILEDSKIEILTTKSKESFRILNHSCAHILAQAILRLYPNSKRTIGPPTDDGFFFDFDDLEITDNDFEKIEKEMRKIVSEKLEIKKVFKSIDETKKVYENNPLKLKIIENIINKKNEDSLSEGNLEDDKFSFYEQGEYTDLCLGPHTPNTSFVKSFKLLKTTKAYFLGDSKNKQLTRIYGISFFKQKELDDYLKMMEESKKRDHRILSKTLEIYTISDLVGSGLPMFKPNGVFLRNQIESFLWELHKKEGYQKVWTPHLAKTDLYKKSGHYDMYEENFKVKGKDTDFMMKPMNCPHHMQIFDDNLYSYKDMPIRYFEPTTVYRDELSGALTGLTRVRSITQDDGHLFLRVSQIKKEVKTIVNIIKTFYKTFNMEDFWVSLSVRGEDKEKYLGTEEVWEKSESSLKEVCDELHLNYKEIKGEAAFYGPKLDFMFKDCIGRVNQLSTIQLDFNLPNRFDLSYVNEDGVKERPVVIHRAIGGSLERVIALLIEHFEGKFPLWISPNQIMILNVADRHQKKCEEIQNLFLENDFRCDIDFSNETISNKIRQAQIKKYNYIIVVGDKELESENIAVRDRSNKTTNYELSNFLELIKIEKDEKAFEIEKEIKSIGKNEGKFFI